MIQDEANKESNVKSTVDAIAGLVKEIPVYQDAVQPAAQQIGKSLEVVTKTVNIALAPIKALVWGYEKIEEFVVKRVSEKLKNIPDENITTPLPQLAGPTIEALRYSGHDENLRELYANLLATAMDITTQHKAHPGFVEIIKSITSDEAILLQAFATQSIYPIIDVKQTYKSGENKNGYHLMVSNYSHLHKTFKVQREELIPSYFDNLCRLGILEIPTLTVLTAPDTYEPLETDPELDDISKKIKENVDAELTFTRKVIRLTSFGQNFVQNVVIEKSSNGS